MNRTLCLAAMAACIALPARADRPLVSETADVIPTGSCQVETAAARLSRSGSPSANTLNALFSCGVAGIHQVAAGYGRSRSGGETVQSLILGGKSTLLAPDAGSTGFGVAYAVTLVKTPQQSFEHEGTSILAVATRELVDGLLGHANLGWSRSQSARLNSSTWSLGFEYGSERTVAADIFGDDRSRPWVSAGFGWTVVDKLSVNLAYAQQFETPRVKQVSVGFKIVF